ncbi:MAG: hypothetical protein EXQ86_06260 [Rhodospirillales bacterium]|nr:hypothetical protein [Rhodospirillales bacterium]
MPKFEVGIYNEQVREALKDGRKHRRLNDEWAEINYIEVEAETADAARAKAKARHPAQQGYVIAHIGPSLKADR